MRRIRPRPHRFQIVRGEPRMRSRRSSVVMAICVVLLTASAPGSGAASTVPSGHVASSIDWTPCHQGTGFPFECGVLQVPLDYSNPQGASIKLALVRLPASDPSHRIGSLFLNPGGPGGSGVDFAVAAAPFLYGGAIQGSFDIVGFDPRGIDRSTPLRCFDSSDEWGPIFTKFAFPRTPREEQLWQKADLYLVDNCAHRGNPILDHMATADAARDMDRMRAAVGDEKLTYMGVSYGSYLGVTYANLFPNHVRAVIVDGVLDPIAWATGVDRGSPHRSLLHPAAQRHGSQGHAGRVLPALRPGWFELRVRAARVR